MLTYPQLLALRKSLKSTPVLSVYVNGEVHDPAQRNAWRQVLRDAIDEVNSAVVRAPREERLAFWSALAALDLALAPIEAAIRAPGWVAFVTADGVRFSGPVPAPMPTMVRWQQGVWVSPFMRALKQHRPVLVLLLDNHTVVLHRYEDGASHQLRAMHASAHGGHADHMSSPPREGFHPGTRGASANDLADRALVVAREQMLHEMLRRIRALALPDATIVIGGIPEVAAAAIGVLQPEFGDHLTVDPGLHIRATEAEIVESAQRGAQTVRDRRDRAAIAQLLDAAGAHSLGVFGLKETLATLRLSQVRELLLTANFLEQHPVDAETAVQAALNQDAAVEIVTGTAADPLDRAGGIGALLRFLVVGESVVAAAGTAAG